MLLEKGIVEGNHKPSSVIPPFPANSGIGRDDGHLSRDLIAQVLKRPHPFRLCPDTIFVLGQI
jgi:hypothetical protein